MISIYDCITMIKKETGNLRSFSERLERSSDECDFDKLLGTAEKCLQSSSTIYLMARDLISSMYMLIPSFPFYLEEDKVDFDTLRVSIETIKEFDYPVYRISFPFLLPNKRKKKVDFNDAMLHTVNAALRRYRDDYGVQLFDRAIVIFVSYYEDQSITIDNDNKETSVILNGLSGILIRDDHVSVCDTIYCAKKSDQGERTEVYVTDSDHDLDVYAWIKAK